MVGCETVAKCKWIRDCQGRETEIERLTQINIKAQVGGTRQWGDGTQVASTTKIAS